MRDALREYTDQPLRALAGCWAAAMLTPFLLRSPLPEVVSSIARQDFLLAALLFISSALIVRQYFLQRPREAEQFWRFERRGAWALCALALFIAWSAASVLWAKNPSAASYYAAKWVGFTLFFVSMRRAAERPRLLRLSLLSLAAVTALVGVICLGDAWVTAHTELPRLTGFGEPQAVAVPIFAALALRLRRRREAFLCAAAAALAWGGVLQMWQRAALIAAVASLVALALGSLLFRQHRPRSVKRVTMIFAAFTLVTAIQAAPSWTLHEGANESIFARTAETVAGQKGLDSDRNTSVRLMLWAVAFEMWRERPLTGVGANNFDAAYTEGRRAFATRHPDSPLLSDREDLTAQRAHNEYLQMLAELGAPGFLFFLLFCLLLMGAAWRAVSRSRSPLALGAACSLVAFALGSGASSASFRWFMSGLMFFFAAALVFRFAAPHTDGGDAQASPSFGFSPLAPRLAVWATAALSLTFLLVTGRQAAVAVLRQAAATADAGRAERLYRAALTLNDGDPETHYAFGLWLFTNRRHAEAVPRLRRAVEHGINDAGTFSLLASAEAGSDDPRAAAATLALAEAVYPRSLFLRVRHASALAEAGLPDEARGKFAEAEAADRRQAIGWWNLLNCGRRCASLAARADRENIALAGELTPQPLVELSLFEAEVLPPRRAGSPPPPRPAAAND